MKVIVLGTGAIGAYYGGHLARAGHAVTCFARGANLAAIQERGLEVRTPEGAFRAHVTATDRAEALAPADFAILAVKSYSLVDIAPLVRHCAEARPDWDFVLVGATAGLPQEALPPRANLRFLGEVEYGEVAGLVAGFDVCVVPFLDNELTRCVNPVKVYEYLAAGKPVVASALPELVSLEPGLVHIGRSREEFLGRLDAAMGERSDSALASRRRAWAAQQTWTARAVELLQALP